MSVLNYIPELIVCLNRSTNKLSDLQQVPILNTVGLVLIA